jgi:N-acetylglucosamine-6-phosphate deacetylase
MAVGTNYIVHFANGPIGYSWKPFHNGGAFEGGLRLPIAIELIADFYHIAPWYLSDFIQRRVQQGRAHEIILVTDALFPIIEELPAGEFLIGSNLGVVSPDKKILFARGHYEHDHFIPALPDTLCSSLLNMQQAFTNILNLLTVNYQGMMIDVPAKSLEAALLLLAQFCATNQAKLVHLADKTGSIARGKDADVVVLKIEGSPGVFDVKVQNTFVKGRKVFG